MKNEGTTETNNTEKGEGKMIYTNRQIAAAKFHKASTKRVLAAKVAEYEEAATIADDTGCPAASMIAAELAAEIASLEAVIERYNKIAA